MPLVNPLTPRLRHVMVPPMHVGLVVKFARAWDFSGRLGSLVVSLSDSDAWVLRNVSGSHALIKRHVFVDEIGG